MQLPGILFLKRCFFQISGKKKEIGFELVEHRRNSTSNQDST